MLLFVIGMTSLTSGDMVTSTAISGSDHMFIENQYGDVKETAAGSGDYAYKSISNQVEYQTFQSEFQLNSTAPKWTNQYAISVNNHNVGVGQSFASTDLKHVSTSTQIGSASSLLQTDINVAGFGNTHAWITKAITTGYAISADSVIYKSHPQWASESLLSGNFSFSQKLSATPEPITIQGAGNWLEGNGSVSVNPNTGEQVTPASSEAAASQQQSVTNALPVNPNARANMNATVQRIGAQQNASYNDSIRLNPLRNMTQQPINHTAPVIQRPTVNPTAIQGVTQQQRASILATPAINMHTAVPANPNTQAPRQGAAAPVAAHR